MNFQIFTPAGLTMTGFMVVMGIGLVILLLSALVGFVDHDVTDIHMDHPEAGSGDAPSVFSVRNLSAFAVGFGAVGGISLWAGASAVMAHVYGIMFGVLMLLAVYSAFRTLWKSQTSSHFVATTLVGKKAIVEVSIEPNQIGEVKSDDDTGVHRWMTARSNNGQAIPRGTVVVIKDIVGNDAIVAVQ